MKLTCRQTHSVIEGVVMPNEVSGQGTMFSGLVIHHMEMAGNAAIARALGLPSKTLTVTDSHFFGSVEANSFYRVEAFLTGTGDDYIESFVRFYVCDRYFRRQYMAASAFITYEPITPDGKDIDMPHIIPETEAEKTLYYSFDERDPKIMAMKRYICKLYPTDCSI